MDNEQQARQMARVTGASYPVVPDPDRAIINRYGVYNLLGDSVAAPATFVIGKNAAVRWSHIGADVSDRPSPAEILQHLA